MGSILIGMGGWQLEPFNGVFYPRKQPKGFRRLEFYSRFFDLIEVNATYHSNGFSPAQSRRWLEDISGNPAFQFTVKLFKGFTHTMDATERDVTTVLRLLEPLAMANRLGGIVVQFPYSFTNTQQRRAHVSRLSTAFRSHRLFVEFRHDSWNTPEILDFLRKTSMHPVNVDLPKFKRLMPFTTFSADDAAYFRLMGRNNATWDHSRNMPEYAAVSNRYMYNYSADELQKIAGSITSIQPASERKFVVFHNDPKARSLINGYQIRRLLFPTTPLFAPDSLRRTFPEVAAITQSVPPLKDGLF